MQELENLEEQGRLVVLPCGFGDIVYLVRPDVNIIEEIKITGFSLGKNIRWFEYIVENCMKYLQWGLINKTVFRTKEEAEQALKECEGK